MIRRVVLVLALAAAVASCRSRSKTVAPPVTAPPAAAAAAELPAQTVASPERDFIPETKPAADEIATADLEQLNRIARERGWIQDAFFDYDRSHLSDAAQQALTRSAQWLRQRPEISVVLEGHCDERGTEQYNLALGDRRAHAAREYLVSLGIDDARVRTVSYGEERPFAEGHDEPSWSQNRRAHFVLSR